VLARLGLLRGQLEAAEAQARAAMQFFASMPVYLAHVAPVQIQALLGLGNPAAACQVAQQVLDLVPSLGGFGVAEVELRLVASEAFAAAGAKERAHAELAETLRQIELRVADITDPFWRNSYLTRNSSCVRAQLLAKQWNLGKQNTPDQGTRDCASSEG
jgi:hypothetical protein